MKIPRRNYTVENDRKLASIKWPHSEIADLSLSLSLPFVGWQKKGSEKERKGKTENRQKNENGGKRCGDLVREKVSTFPTTLSVADNASAAAKYLRRIHRSFFLTANTPRVEHGSQITGNTAAIKFLTEGEIKRAFQRRRYILTVMRTRVKKEQRCRVLCARRATHKNDEKLRSTIELFQVFMERNKFARRTRTVDFRRVVSSFDQLNILSRDKSSLRN